MKNPVFGYTDTVSGAPPLLLFYAEPKLSPEKLSPLELYRFIIFSFVNAHFVLGTQPFSTF